MSEPIVTGEVITPHEHKDGSLGGTLFVVALGFVLGLAAYYLYRSFRGEADISKRIDEAFKAGYHTGQAHTEMGIEDGVRASGRADDNGSDADTPPVVAKPRRSNRKTAVVDADDGDSESLA